MLQQHKQYSRPTLRIFFILSVLSMVLPASAEEVGRYRAVVMNDEGGTGQPGSHFPKVFIIDSKEGHMWTWEDKKKIKNLDNKFSFGTAVTYQGRVKPGKKMGEIIEQSMVGNQ